MTHTTSSRSNGQRRLLAAVLLLCGLPTLAPATPPSIVEALTFTGNLPEGGSGALPLSNVSHPARALFAAPDGWLYGANVHGGGSRPVSFGGGAGGKGSIFYRFQEGSGQQALERRPYADNEYLNSGQSNWLQYMTLGSDGRLYSTGTGQDGGTPGLWRYDTGNGWQMLRALSNAADGVAAPVRPWVEGPDGRLYADNNSSKLYALGKDGATLTVIHELSTDRAAPDYPGWRPRFLLSHDGRLYGALSQRSATEGANALFSIAPDGSGFAILRRFADAGDPQVDTLNVAGLVAGTDGWLYGATHRGGANGTGALFRIREDGSDYARLHDFGPDDANTDGLHPTSLIRGADGHYYGTAKGGGIHASGTIFRWHRDDGFQVLAAFDPVTGPPANYVEGYDTNIGSNATGIEPYNLVQDGQNRFYGLARLGGGSGWGALFRFEPGDEVPAFHFQPSVTLAATVQSRANDALALGLSATLSWRGQAVKDCVAGTDEPGSSWTGARASSGSENMTPQTLGRWTYTLDCASDSSHFPEPVRQSVTLRVEPVDAQTVPVGNGGGSFGPLPLGALTLLAALGAGLRRRDLRAS